MQKPNPIELVFQDIAKFDTENAIIGSLSYQMQSQKLIDQQVNEYLGKVPSIKDKEIKERLENLKKRSVSNDNNDYDDSSIFGKSP